MIMKLLYFWTYSGICDFPLVSFRTHGFCSCCFPFGLAFLHSFGVYIRVYFMDDWPQNAEWLGFNFAHLHFTRIL